MHRLTLLTTGLARGGAEAQVVLLARLFQARGWCVEVISMLPPQAHSEELMAAGIPVHDLKMRRGVPDPRALFRLARLLRRSRPDVLHCHMVHANLLGRLVRPLVRIPVVISTAHSMWEGPRWREWAYRLTDHLCDLTTNVSSSAVERYVRVGAAPEGKIIFAANGIDADLYVSDAAARFQVRVEHRLDECFVWLAVGNLREPKDYPTMLKAMVALAHHPRKHTLLIAGSGELEAHLREQERHLGLTGRIRWLGSRADVPALMNAADAFVISSSLEGTPIALLEAAASGLPLVATRVGGIPEVVDDGRNGYLVPSGEPQALAIAMDRLMRLGEAERCAMGLSARDRVMARHSIVAVGEQWTNIYEGLLGAQTARAKSRAAMPLRARRSVP